MVAVLMKGDVLLYDLVVVDVLGVDDPVAADVVRCAVVVLLRSIWA
jgi:hypothetical protein